MWVEVLPSGSLLKQTKKNECVPVPVTNQQQPVDSCCSSSLLDAVFPATSMLHLWRLNALMPLQRLYLTVLYNFLFPDLWAKLQKMLDLLCHPWFPVW